MNKFKRITQTQWLMDKVEEIHPYSKDMKMPKRATNGSAGYDIFALADFTLNPGETIILPTGLSVVTDPDKFLGIFPRSGLGFKFRTQLWNTVGIIDSDYHDADNEGHMWVKMINESDKVLNVKEGEAFCQAVLLPFFKMDDDIEPDEKRIGGFGSTTR